jgi:hypothetical protein
VLSFTGFFDVVEITLGLELLLSSDKIGNSGRVGGSGGSGGVEISSKVFNILDAWIETLESTTELCITGEEEDGTYSKK